MQKTALQQWLSNQPMGLGKLPVTWRHDGGEKSFGARDLPRLGLWYFYLLEVEAAGRLLTFVMIMHSLHLISTCPRPGSTGAPTIQRFYESDSERIFRISELFC